MRRLGRYAALLALSPLLLTATACGEQAKPPPAGAKLCVDTMARWWFDATGSGDLYGAQTGNHLPLHPTLYYHVRCDVYSGKKASGLFIAQVTTKDNVRADAMSVAKGPASGRFSVAGGKGNVWPKNDDDGTDAWWTCGSAALHVELRHTRDVKKRIELTKTLARRIASVVGCPKLPSD